MLYLLQNTAAQPVAFIIQEHASSARGLHQARCPTLSTCATKRDAQHQALSARHEARTDTRSDMKRATRPDAKRTSVHCRTSCTRSGIRSRGRALKAQSPASSACALHQAHSVWHQANSETRPNIKRASVRGPTSSARGSESRARTSPQRQGTTANHRRVAAPIIQRARPCIKRVSCR